ncbi:MULTISPECIES: CDP-alcohol phosphatidyltransferase family protein [Streptomyces]|uniref:Phosphatidylglycerophosphate synthase n=1 Tax=Streptomyces venezuelae TaxID=54571 RepID=A0A5P2BI59_STRVZ|nr:MULTISPECIES: CDP-alcohol phosphatidyltransferase family protein [Streptomyces]NEA05857.1 CDP-alcohol phosphatidyltransferase family protein [Streptomyces sp. SID10116]MYY85486.1 CDP-alcohol phosphatidyltransferase family protein [Streptomyces sp. SID335]MYZ17539.1 CDP-alcohol phosphatidyltransferase family protein [Streptomyces sp. SID337]NDZ89397.1 CDP-alcohol phosphatidyltransferase family protein [Streptomyces sp. SID10115]NEB44170.1 CDP-alcohol phosphatidyltransferase family protein [S
MRRDIPPLAEVRRITEKKRDAWWTVMLVDPVATPLVRFTAMRTRVTPNQITWGAFILGLGSAACFAFGDWKWLVLGAVIYHVSFIFDCMDGKLARLTGQGSVFGAWLDFVFDRIRVMVCGVALMWGQYDRTGDTFYIWLALAVVALDTLRYINSLEIFKIRHTMRKQIKARMRAAKRAQNEAELAFMEDLLRDNPSADIEQDLQRAAGEAGAGYVTQPSDGTTGTETDEQTAPKPKAQVIDLHQEFRQKFPAYLRVRSFLLRHRIRAHLVSGIEFQMGVFMIGPLFDAVMPVTIVSGALLLVFELAIIYKLLLSTRDFTRTIDSFEEQKVVTAA